MEDLKEVIQKIFETATNAPELNMANYDESQVISLSDAMLEIYYLVEGAVAKLSEQQSNCNLPQVSKSDGIEREALLIAFFDYMIKNNNVTNMYTDKYMYIGNFLKSKQ